MRHTDRLRSVVIMGVSGAGKSTIGRLLAAELGAQFRDGDDLHPSENVALMAAGYPLGDAERTPWLREVGRYLADARTENESLVVACSALKRAYRDLLREHVPEAFFVFLDGPMPLVHERISNRSHDFMPPSLLASQYLSLEPLQADESGIRVDITMPPDQMIELIAEQLTSAASASRNAS
ncbi:MAG: transferase [Hymenobacter sp.]|jgi:gluconokinase|nr:transferase [Hymenobacter sp.]